MTEKERIGAELKAHRDRLRLSQPEVARLAGISPQTVSHIERGHNTTVDRLESLAEVLDLRFHMTLSRTDIPPFSLELSHIEDDTVRAVIATVAEVAEDLSDDQLQVMFYMLEMMRRGARRRDVWSFRAD